MDDRSEQVLAIAVTFMVICWTTVGLRVYCRLHVVKSFGLDDLSLVILQLVYTVYLISQLLGWQHGTGQHKSALSEANNSQALMFWFICELLYIACTCLLKISAGHFLLRLAVDARHVWVLRALMLSTAAFGTAYFFMVLFQCEPPSVFWESSPRSPGQCWSDGVVLALTYAASAVNCLADWSFGLMPILVVRTLHMPRGTKVLVGCLMSFAAIASIATIVRMVYIPTLLDGDDFLFHTTDVAIWSTVEVGIGIAALSMAALHPLLTFWRRRLGLRHPHSAATGTADSSSLPLSSTPRRKRPTRLLGPLRRNYMRANSQPDLRQHHSRHRSEQRTQQQQEPHSPLKLRPEETIMHMSSASGPPPASTAAPFSRFALASWIEEGAAGGGGRGSRSSSRSYHSRSNGSSTTELADWTASNSNSNGGGGGGGGSGGITKTTEVSQSQHRLDSLPRMEAVLLSKAGETHHETPTTNPTTKTTTTTIADKAPRLALVLPVPSLAAFIVSAGHRWSLGSSNKRPCQAIIGEESARGKG
ncbi:hypothetical protein PGQ11_005880 [Apiospora arundinis]|uniref:Rhodopsin domain-containing protein n=1 Tax=Apiospora arundinis TaxID=335852 RepID=A0ABR2IQU0_9PEZI